jgi:hypothetical protein
MLKEPYEPSLFDEIQTVVFARPDKNGRVLGVLNQNLRLCLVCEEVFTTEEGPNTPRETAIRSEKGLTA